MVRRTAPAAAACVLVCVLTLLAAPAAKAAPIISFQCTPAPADCLGWYRTNVTLTWTVQPADATRTGCANTTYSADTPPGGTDAICRAVDTNGQAASIELKIRRDATPPVVTGGQPARSADLDGWYNRAVGVTFAGSDLTSGIASCTSTTYGGPDSATASVAGTCVDKAGNTSAPLGFGLKYDSTAPTVSGAQPERAANGNGWFNRAVRFDIAGSDATSGIADCPPITYSGPDSATAAFTAACRDRAGNSATRAFALKYDATAPTATSAAAARGTDAGGWYNHPVAVAYGGTDQLSGIDGCTASTYSGPDGAAASLAGTCTDRAGNVSAPLAFALKYDATKPVVSGGQPARGADSGGWYNRSVAVSFSGTDQTAGVESCTSATYAGPDSGTASLAGTCRDRAGNLSDPLGYGLKYDATAPQVSAADPDRQADANGWFNHPVGFTVRGTDATSGIASCPVVSYSGPASATASITGTCRDVAGNSASRGFGLQYDDVAPTITKGTAARAADFGGWYNRPVAIAYEGTDGLSGLSGCSTVTYAGPDSTAASPAGTCTDRAGNVSQPLAFGLKYDATAPTVTSGTPGRGADANGWYNHAVTVAFAGTDPVSGVGSCTSATYDGADSATAAVAGTCTDKAGNTSGPFGFGLKYDDTPPQVTAGTPRRTPDVNGWYNRAVAFDFAGADATSGIGSCPSVTYAGPDGGAASVTGRCTDRAGNSADRQFGLAYDATAPDVASVVASRPPDSAGWYNRPVTVTFAGADGTSGVDGCTTTTYAGPDAGNGSVTGTCTDRAGNVSGTDALAIKYDATPPSVDDGVAGRPPDVGDWYNAAVPVAFSGADATSGVDACTHLAFDGPDSKTATVAGTCRDKAGNVSAAGRFDLQYDATGPVVTGAEPDRAPNPNGWYVQPVRFTFGGTDATSGLDVCLPADYTGPDGPDAVVVGRCRDHAGNGGTRSFALHYDATPPALSLSAQSGDGSVALSWQTSPDVTSVTVLRTPGLDGAPSSIVFGGLGASFVDGLVDNGTRYSYEVRVADAAGNASTQSIAAFPAVPPPGGEPAPAVAGVVAEPGIVAPALLPRRRPRIAPAAGSVFAADAPPRLRWPAVKRARYYNVQLFRGKHKLMSVWPVRPHYQLKRRWRFHRKPQRLVPGTYRWMVWPGYGPRAKARYGKRLVRRTFSIAD
jgi:hypothetical protein